MNDKKDLQDLALNLDKLTGEEGPLLRLVCEVRKSNDLALRNVRLQMLSLFALFLCLVCLLFLSFVFYEGLYKLEQSEAHLAAVTQKLASVEASVGEVRDEVEEAPKIVADDSGQLKVVANVRLDETLLQAQQSLSRLKASNEEVGKHLESAMDIMGSGDSLQSYPKVKSKPARKVEIPIDVKKAAEADD